MHAEAAQLLKEIGSQLDKNIFPRVKNGGIVVPSGPAGSRSTLGMETDNDETARQRRPATRPWKGTSGRQGTARGPRPSREAAPDVRPGIPAQYEAELAAVSEAYPGTQVWHQDKGLWLLMESSLLPGLTSTATFAVGICFAASAVRGWGFWGGLLAGSSWIGPRHTNYPDGSICAFEPRDRTWAFGDPIVTLLDLYTLWALRHLYLQTFGRWPGRQAVHLPYERILELRPDEYCGCDNSERLYGECCRDKDLARNRLADAFTFLRHPSGGLRKPPDEVVRFVHAQKVAPQFNHPAA